MKALAIAFSLTLLASPSLAGVRVLALCSTSDGEYTLAVTDNQGKLPLKKSQIFGAIKDSNGCFVAACLADAVQTGEGNFGYRYQDSSTQGQRFFLEVSPTLPGRFHIEAIVKKGDALVKISDFEMQCSAFNTYLPGR